MTGPVQAPPGATAYFGSMLATLHFWGFASDLNVPAGVCGSFEINGTEGAIVLDAIKGDKGDPGTPSPIVKMQYEDDFSDASQLPSNLENISEDIGKAWWIGNAVYMWSGTTWYQKQMGTQGPVGPPPALHVSAELVPSGQVDSLTQPVEVTPSTSNGGLDVNLLFRFDHDSIEGPEGPAAAIRSASDWDDTVAPINADVPVWNSAISKFQPKSLSLLGVEVYSVPQSYFQAAAGPTVSGQQVLAFPVPPRPFAWKPVILNGHMKVFGAEVSTNPLQIGCQVLLGAPAGGTQIGRGYGTILQWTTIQAEYSTPGNPAAAITPENALAYVPPNHVGNAGTIYVVLANDGAIGAFTYDPAGSQLTFAIVPVPTQA